MVEDTPNAKQKKYLSVIWILYILVPNQSARLPELLGHMSNCKLTGVAVVDLMGYVVFEQSFEAHGELPMKISFLRMIPLFLLFPVIRVDILGITNHENDVSLLEYPVAHNEAHR